MTAYDPAAWHDFCIAFAGASGALLGLAFVAISFIIADNALPGSSGRNPHFLRLPACQQPVILAPGLSHTAQAIGLAILAAGLLMLVLKVDLPRWQHERAGPLAWRLGHAAPGSLLTTLAVIAALATITTSIGGLYWLAGAMAVATSAGLINSWVLLVEIKR
jgi:hypothetical protein